MIRILSIFIFSFVFLFGCAKKDGSSHSGLRIFLQDQAPLSPKPLMSLMPSFQNLLTPASSSDFNCFALNINGPGMPVNVKGPEGCVFTNNVTGRGFGLVTDLAPRGIPIAVEVPSGNSRTIDVYGIDPPPDECGGSSANITTRYAYFLGTKTVDLVDSIDVVIPISYSGSGSNLTCTETNNSTQTVSLVPTGTSGNGHKIYRNTSSTCFVDQATISNANAPSLGSMSEISSAEYSDVSSVDGTLLYTECDYSGANFNTQVAYFVWDLSSVNISNYSSLTVKWRGAAGHYSSACNATTTSLGHGGGSTPPLWLVQIWKYNSGSGSVWVDVGTNSINQSLVTSNFTGINQYKDSSNLVWVRVVADDPGATNYCSTVQTDYAELVINP